MIATEGGGGGGEEQEMNVAFTSSAKTRTKFLNSSTIHSFQIERLKLFLWVCHDKEKEAMFSTLNEQTNKRNVSFTECKITF